jgi:hypothetical protein
MEEDPAFLEHGRHRFDTSDPPPPYSSGSVTRPPTPDPFRPAPNGISLDELLRKPLSREEIHLLIRVGLPRPHHRYNDEFNQEKDRIEHEYCRRDKNYKPLYHGPDLTGRAGQQRLRIMIRHSIKKRWERLGVWQPEWGIPRCVHYRAKDDPGDWDWKRDRDMSDAERKYNSLPPEAKMASWPMLDEEYPSERAVRLYLKEKGEWDETLDPQQPPVAESSTWSPVADHRYLITARPWFMWHIEIEEEELRLRRDPNCSDYWHPARNNVTTRWKEKGHWKDSWGDEPGWKWRHESPSPEPPDPSCMEFTPSEIDALEEIPPPTPRPAPDPVSPAARTPEPLGFIFRPVENVAIPSISTPPGDEQDPDVHIPEGTAASAQRESASRRLDEDACTAPRAEHNGPPVLRSHRQGGVGGKRRNRYELQNRQTMQRVTRSACHTNGLTEFVRNRSPIAAETRRTRQASRVLTSLQRSASQLQPPVAAPGSWQENNS